MAITKYTHSKLCNIDRLTLEIGQSNIVTALDRIETKSSPATTDTYFKAALSTGDETTLNTLITNHTNTPLAEVIEPRDSDNSRIVRPKTTKTGWHYEPRSLDFLTSKYNSLYNRKHDGNTIADGTDYGDAHMKFYNASGNELSYQQAGFESETEAEFQTRLTSGCVKTIVNWQPTYDMDIIGGIVMIKNPPTSDAYMWSIAAPQLAEQYGGQVPFAAGGWNLSFMGDTDKLIVNGRGSKTVQYDPVYNTNEFSLII